MSRFLKSAAFPILIVVVLAFFAQKLFSPGPAHQAELPAVPPAGGGRADQVCGRQDQGQRGPGHAQERPEVRGRLSGRLRQRADQQAHRVQRQLRRRGHQVQRLALAAHLRPAVPDLHRLLDIPDEPGPRRRIEGHVVRQVARQAHVGRLAQDHLPRRRRRGRGGGGAPRDQGVPREPEEVPGARCAHSQGRAALRAAGHRQDPARARRRGRGGRAVLLDLGLGLRRDVRRRGRLARA